MVESIAATSLLGYRPLCGWSASKDLFDSKRKVYDGACRIPVAEFYGRRISVVPLLPRLRSEGLLDSSVKAVAMELTKEYSHREEERIPRSWNYQIDVETDRKPGVWPQKNRADNPSLHNPLLRQERMSCGWLGVIFEWEGVLVEDNPDLEKQVWLTLAQEEGQSPPLAFLLRRI